MTTVAIYTRLSSDRTGQQTATARQEEACRKFADLKDWAVGEVFEDVDVSAYQKGVVRPGYDALLRALADGRCDGVVVWKLDRLVRRPVEFERFWDVCESRGGFLASAMEPIDSSTDLGLALVRILVAFASLESATSSARIRAKSRELAEAGRPWGARGYGHTEDRQGVIAHEAKAIRFMAREIARGIPASAVTAELQRRSWRSPKGRNWAPGSVARLLRQPRLVGDRSHHGQVVVKGCFAPILDRTTWAKVQLRLESRPGRSQRNRPELLVGLLWCGRCGGRLRPSSSAPDGHLGGFACYANPSGCGKVRIAAEPLEAWIRDAVLWRIARRNLTGGRPRKWTEADKAAVGDELTAHAAALQRLNHDHYVERTLGRAEFLQARRELLNAAEAAERASRPTTPQPRGNLEQLRQRWEGLGLRDRRMWIDLELQGAAVGPSSASGRFDPHRIKPQWWDPFSDLEDVPSQLIPPVQPSRRQVQAIRAVNPPPPRQRRSASRPRFGELSVSEAAVILGLRVKVVRALIRSGQLKGHLIEGWYWMSRRDVDRFIASTRVAPARPASNS